jgi:predicted 3-demethylubiquinone-9 3-methyltransferase (glyoxalase superfamily)
MTNVQKITPCLWFDGQAEDAAKTYVSIFPNSKILEVSRYGEAGRETHGQKPGTVLAVRFLLEGQEFTALNGGPQFQFSEAISFHVHCDTQAEIDHYWSKLARSGDEGQCGWLKDRWGLSWQIVPRRLGAWMSDPDPARAGRTMRALMAMKKLDIAALERAHEGRS